MYDKNAPLVSVVIPCRNEKEYIAKCLDSLLEQDYPKEKIEILLTDGMSEDGTREIIDSYTKQYSFIKKLDNPEKYTPFGLNIGIKRAAGDVIIRMDAHAGYEKKYISKCVTYLLTSGADNVGGAIKTMPAGNTAAAKAIAMSLSHPFGAASRFRKGLKKPEFVDTAFGGCFKKDVFTKIGYFNERLIRTQDLEFNLRLRRAGGKILLAPDIISYYYPKADFKNFFIHNVKDGIWSVYPLKFIKMPLLFRHYIPLLFVSGLIIFSLLSFFSKIFIAPLLLIILPYIILSAIFSLRIAIREKDFRYLFLMPVAFVCRHFGYGIGSVWGAFKLIL